VTFKKNEILKNTKHSVEYDEEIKEQLGIENEFYGFKSKRESKKNMGAFT
jgi:hypothetical protein